MKRILLSLSALLVITVLSYAPVARAGDIPSFTITDGMNFNKIELYDLEFTIDGFPIPFVFPPTTVDMTGGHVGEISDSDSGMFTYESSTFNMSGGVVDYLYTYNSSTANISGGLVSEWDCFETDTISAHDSSTVNVYDGALLFGGSFHHFNLYDSATLNVHGGDVGLLLFARNSSIVNIYGGDLYEIIPYDSSTVNVYGGYIRVFWSNTTVPAMATVNIYGYGFNYNPEAQWRYLEDPNDGWWVSKLTGYGCDGRSITYWGLPDPAAQSNINLIPDFALDRGVNLTDFAILASAWRSGLGDGNWNQVCDISDPNDDVIDERDLGILTKYWLSGVGQ